MADPTPRRARQLELWRGRARAAADDADATLERFERAMGMAEREASPAERCETAATVAVQTALLAGRADRDDLLGRAEAFAERALQITPDLNGQHPWTAQSLAVKAAALLRAGKPDVAATTAISAWSNLEGRLHMAPEFEARLLMLRVLGATNSPLEASAIETVREQLQEVALHTLDGAVRERWYESPLQRGLEAIVGKIPPPAQPTQEGQAALATLTMREAHLLRLVTSGMTNREIAAELGTPIEAVAEDVETVFSKLGVNSRLTATTFALREGVA
jgi:DNA-binding CsgD family transcriptional regulator